jgi:chaperonin GroEL
MHKFTKEIIIGEDLRRGLRAGVNKLAQAVLVTLGPYGKTVILTSDIEPSYITKDGVSVAKRIKLRDPIENVAADLIKEVAEKTLALVGDGTTTSICLANELINIGFDLINEGIPYMDVKKDLDLLTAETLRLLEEGAKPLEGKDAIEQVATISANNDIEIGRIISEAYAHSNIVKVYEGSKQADELVLTEGMEVETTYWDKAFINVMEKQSIKYDESFNVIIIDGKLLNLDPIAGILKQTETLGKNFVIIADHFGDQANNLFKENHNRGALTIVPIKSPGFGKHRKDLLSDIAYYTGAKVLEENKKYASIASVGKITKVEVTPEKAFLVVDKVDPQRINELKQYKNTLEGDNPMRILIERRIGALEGKASSIFVGGNSEVEMKERYDRVDDAVRAVNSAIEEGIVEGGGVALVRAYNVLCNMENINQRLNMALLAPSYRIFVNSDSKINTDFTDSRFEQNIVDPLKVTKMALQNAVSVSSTILGTEAIVLDESLWK